MGRYYQEEKAVRCAILKMGVRTISLLSSWWSCSHWQRPTSPHWGMCLSLLLRFPAQSLCRLIINHEGIITVFIINGKKKLVFQLKCSG